ncbi:30S ribosomal protein S8 [Patescibacteria group bacterium]|nr:30S ribosomal protein S8 [Patescibacteria group bacterium]MBU4017372.1 30S ribosomal protein S8 [Patescibacteria group bacterium]MBU4098787.1 30S ribosomal protein S8 [Patescibacteria group bacterium]
MNYTIGDFVIRLKNAALARKKELYVPFSKIQKEIGKVLVKEGFLEDIKEDEIEGKKTLYVKLRYQRRRPAVTDIAIISKPSLRVYVGSDEIARKQGKAKTVILSTNSGIITGKEAIKKKVGGELLFKIW